MNAHNVTEAAVLVKHRFPALKIIVALGFLSASTYARIVLIYALGSNVCTRYICTNVSFHLCSVCRVSVLHNAV